MKKLTVQIKDYFRNLFSGITLKLVLIALLFFVAVFFVFDLAEKNGVFVYVDSLRIKTTCFLVSKEKCNELSSKQTKKISLDEIFKAAGGVSFNGSGTLNLPVNYFSIDDVRWGSVGNGNGDKITDYTQVALENETVYQSYPTTNITIKEYSNKIKPLNIKSYTKVLEELSKLELGWWSEKVVEDNYKEFGSLATHYLPTDNISLLDKFDVDEDKIKETVVTYNYTGAADAGSYKSDIIKGNNVIFSVQEDNASIVPADITNGFYVEWRSQKDESPRCCATGFMRTRFVLKDGGFVPIYEQEVKYFVVGKAN